MPLQRIYVHPALLLFSNSSSPPFVFLEDSKLRCNPIDATLACTACAHGRSSRRCFYFLVPAPMPSANTPQFVSALPLACLMKCLQVT
jgi:hypothetical protein